MLITVRRAMVLMMCAVLSSPGCATTGVIPSAQTPVRGAVAEASVLSEYVQRLPPGSTVRVERTTGKALQGTLMKATDRSVVIQPRTRIPEPPVEVALTDVRSVTPESPEGRNMGRAIAVGAAAGAGAALAVFLIIVAAYAD